MLFLRGESLIRESVKIGREEKERLLTILFQRESLEGVLKAVEGILDYSFQNRDLLIQALTHSSFSNEGLATSEESWGDNERFEFLGDAVLGLVIASILMELFPEASEGKLSRWRSGLVSRKTLAQVTLDLGLGQYLLLGRGERRTGGAEKRSILAACFEALVAALYLEGGLKAATRFIRLSFSKYLDGLASGGKTPVELMDKKTHLQERAQFVYKTTPVYRVAEVWGPEHEKQFRVEIMLDGRVIACGDGSSKKEAEQDAASVALDLLGI